MAWVMSVRAREFWIRGAIPPSRLTSRSMTARGGVRRAVGRFDRSREAVELRDGDPRLSAAWA